MTADEDGLWKEMVKLRRAIADKEFPNRTAEFRAILASTYFRAMEIADGAAKERGAVIVEITWGGTPEHCSELVLWRDTGHVWANAEELMQSPTARRLDFERAGKPLRYVDVDVQNRSSYTYYAIVEATANGQRHRLGFEKQNHVARFVETQTEFVERKISQKEIEERLRAATQPPPKPRPIKEQVIEHLNERFTTVAGKREAIRIAEDYIDSLDADNETKEILFAEALKVIQGNK